LWGTFAAGRRSDSLVGGYGSGSLGAANANIFDPVTHRGRRAEHGVSPLVPDIDDAPMAARSSLGRQTMSDVVSPDVPEIFDPVTNPVTDERAQGSACRTPVHVRAADGKVTMPARTRILRPNDHAHSDNSHVDDVDPSSKMVTAPRCIKSARS